MFNNVNKNSLFLTVSVLISGCSAYSYDPYPNNDYYYYHTTAYIDNNSPSYIAVPPSYPQTRVHHFHSGVVRPALPPVIYSPPAMGFHAGTIAPAPPAPPALPANNGFHSGTTAPVAPPPETGKFHAGVSPLASRAIQVPQKDMPNGFHASTEQSLSSADNPQTGFH